MRIRAETKPMQQSACASTRVVAVDFGEFLMRGSYRIPVFRSAGFSLRDQHGMHFAIARHHEIDRGIRQRRRFLRDAGDAQA